LREENIERRLTDGRFHTPPAERRKLEKKESDYRRKKKEYRRLVRWVLSRKMRGF